MQRLKFQVEIRYTAILNFQEENRRILSPFLKIAEAAINNDQTFGEYIVLFFKAEQYYLDCRWDRIILVCEGERRDIADLDGPLSHLYNILDRYKKLESFGKITQMIIASWALIKSTENFESVVSNFKRSYLSQNIPSEFSNPNDIAIVLESKEKNKFSSRFTFGPFDSERDLEKFGIFALNKEKLLDYQKVNGIFMELIENHITVDVDFDNYLKFLKRHNFKLNNFK